MNQLSEKPCPRCLPLAGFGRIHAETIQRLPANSPPLDMQGTPCCWDCSAADTLLKLGAIGVKHDKAGEGATNFVMARIATGNDRRDQYRLPGAPMGLVYSGILRPSEEGDFEDHLAWLKRNNWFGMSSPDDLEHS